MPIAMAPPTLSPPPSPIKSVLPTSTPHLPPSTSQPPQAEEAPTTDGFNRLRKTKAGRAFRTLIGLFQKPTAKRKSDKEEHIERELSALVGKASQMTPSFTPKIQRLDERKDGHQMHQMPQIPPAALRIESKGAPSRRIQSAPSPPSSSTTRSSPRSNSSPGSYTVIVDVTGVTTSTSSGSPVKDLGPMNYEAMRGLQASDGSDRVDDDLGCEHDAELEDDVFYDETVGSRATEDVEKYSNRAIIIATGNDMDDKNYDDNAFMNGSYFEDNYCEDFSTESGSEGLDFDTENLDPITFTPIKNKTVVISRPDGYQGNVFPSDTSTPSSSSSLTDNSDNKLNDARLGSVGSSEIRYASMPCLSKLDWLSVTPRNQISERDPPIQAPNSQVETDDHLNAEDEFEMNERSCRIEADIEADENQSDVHRTNALALLLKESPAEYFTLGADLKVDSFGPLHDSSTFYENVHGDVQVDVSRGTDIMVFDMVDKNLGTGASKSLKDAFSISQECQPQTKIKPNGRNERLGDNYNTLEEDDDDDGNDGAGDGVTKNDKRHCEPHCTPATTPIKQKLLATVGELLPLTPLTPCKGRRSRSVENDVERNTTPQNNPNLMASSQNRRCPSSRKKLYKVKTTPSPVKLTQKQLSPSKVGPGPPCSLKVCRLAGSFWHKNVKTPRRVKRLTHLQSPRKVVISGERKMADSLKSVADWIMKSMAINGNEKPELFDVIDKKMPTAVPPKWPPTECQTKHGDVLTGEINSSLQINLSESNSNQDTPDSPILSPARIKKYFSSVGKDAIMGDMNIPLKPPILDQDNQNVIYSPAVDSAQDLHNKMSAINKDHCYTQRQTMACVAATAVDNEQQTSMRSRLESGYASRSRSSSLTTPATPLTPLSLSSARHPLTPMGKLQSGRIVSPRSLNALDGLTPSQGRSADKAMPKLKVKAKISVGAQQSRRTGSPKFVFPCTHQQNVTVPALRVVLEVSERSLGVDSPSQSAVAETLSSKSNSNSKSSSKSESPSKSKSILKSEENSKSESKSKSICSSEIDVDCDDVIISGGGDVDSLLTSYYAGSSSSTSGGSAFWSATSNLPRVDQNQPAVGISFNVIDENNNQLAERPQPSPIVVQPSPLVAPSQPPPPSTPGVRQPHFLTRLPRDLPDITSPAIKNLLPISTSSPLHIPAYGGSACKHLKTSASSNGLGIVGKTPQQKKHESNPYSIPVTSSSSAARIYPLEREQNKNPNSNTNSNEKPEVINPNEAEMDKSKKECHLRRRGGSSEKRKRRRNFGTRSARSARTCLRFDEHDEDGKGNEKKKKDNEDDDEDEDGVSHPRRPPSDDYIVLKRAAEFVVDLLNLRVVVKGDADVPALMGCLRDNYQRIVKEHDSFYLKGIKHVSQLKAAAAKMKNKNNTKSNTLAPTVDNCLDRFLLSILIQCPESMNTFADFIFQNLSEVIRKSSLTFFSLAPEVTALLLANDHCVVKGANGFPLAYRAAEKEVLKTAVKFVQRCHSANQPHTVRRVQRLLYQVVDPSIVLKYVFTIMAAQKKDENGNTPSISVPKMCQPRARHRISYRRSDRLPNLDSNGNRCANPPDLVLNSRTCDSSAPADSPQTRAGCSDLRDQPLPDRLSLFELTKYGTINVESPVEVREVCDEEHSLRTLYFCYGCSQGVPFIADIGMQYVSKGKKRTLFIARPLISKGKASRDEPGGKSPGRSCPVKISAAMNTSGISRDKNAIEGSSDHKTGCATSYPVSERPCPIVLKKSALVLMPGEHATAVYVLAGSDVVHNIEIRTSTKRRVRAHGLCDARDATWSPIRAPGQGGPPFCLHALIAETRNTHKDGTRVIRVGAVWAEASWEGDDLNQ